VRNCHLLLSGNEAPDEIQKLSLLVQAEHIFPGWHVVFAHLHGHEQCRIAFFEALAFRKIGCAGKYRSAVITMTKGTVLLVEQS
jgi:hypothetical protein